MSDPGARSSHLSQPVVKSVFVYRNGDPFFAGRRVVIHEKKVSSFDVFLKEVTGGVQAPFGAVRNIYTPRTGHRIRRLDQIESGGNYVAGGQEAFKKLNYLDIGEMKKRSMDAVNTEVKPVIHSRINVSARFRKPLQEPCTIFLIANGDLISPVSRLLIPRKALNQWDHVLQMVTEKITLRSGAVHSQKASSLPPIVGSRKSKGSGNDRQSKSTIRSSDNSSPQPLKRKGKKVEGNSEKPTKAKQNVKLKNSQQTILNSDEGIFKAGAERSEMWGAAEVQEDEETQVEVPVDQLFILLYQRPAEIVDEEEDEEKANIDAEQKEDFSGMNGGAADEGGRDAADTPEHSGEKASPAHVNGGTDEENGEELGQVKNELQSAADEEHNSPGAGSGQDEADLDPQGPPRPEVKITSPQENENNEQNKDYAVVA
ncbi:doublecortin domain-containing protein 2 isoform X3 [Heterocephalus glaber]|uniref:Doublecortin domain-containing protein 2 isoform X3 n=1 Tax=Heterocephalus glaber TaxID=10181 RepID=A0AAX6T5H8_HETGA|nr:doublecortin domain-containing protein 2 isoform X3 [Heterocephalus glaber]